MASIWVVNASPIILLSKVGQLELLHHLGSPVQIPQAAVTEIQRGGSGGVGAQALASANWIHKVAPEPVPKEVADFGLGDGETAVLAHALSNSGSGVIIDDRAARKAAAVLGLPFQGTLGLILFAKKQGLIAAARPVVEELRRSGMYLSEKVMNAALTQVNE